MAHGADLALQLGMNEALGTERCRQLLDAVTRRDLHNRREFLWPPLRQTLGRLP